MKIIGCDFHPSFPADRHAGHGDGRVQDGKEAAARPGEAEQFYRPLQGQHSTVGMEASGNTRWFERLLAEMGHRVVVGDAAQIRRAGGAQAEDRSGGTPSIFWSCCWDGIGFRHLGAERGRAGCAGSCCCIGTNWWRCARG